MLFRSKHYRSRRELFQRFTSGTRKDDTVFLYQGDVLQSSFSLEGSYDNDPSGDLPMDSGMDKLVQVRMKQERSLVPSPGLLYVLRCEQIDGEIFIDTKNYVQKRTGPQCLGNRNAMSDPSICSCCLCEDDNTRLWLESFDEKARAPGSSRDEIDVNDHLLAPRVFGFAMSREIWCQFELSKIQTLCVPYEPTYKGSLVLPDGVVADEFVEIMHMVKYHTRVMSEETDKRIDDDIKGKGEGLILLFHGEHTLLLK